MKLKLERRDLQGIASALEPVVEKAVRTSLAKVFRPKTSPLLAAPFSHEQAQPQPQGIRVMTPEAVSERLGRSVRHLRRLEEQGEIPRRRRIGRRRTGYYEHELEGVPAQSVSILDGRKLNLTELAEKLGVHVRTVKRLKEDGLPEPVEGMWFERDIDLWLLARPQA